MNRVEEKMSVVDVRKQKNSQTTTSTGENVEMPSDRGDEGENLKRCACRGIRRCAMCSDFHQANGYNQDSSYMENCATEKAEEKMETYAYCYTCQKGYRIGDEQITVDLVDMLANDVAAHCLKCPWRDGKEDEDVETVMVEEMLLWPDFVSQEEEAKLIDNIDAGPWVDSQSGRRKQDFGPRVNFKKQKVKLDHFVGLPEYSAFLLDRMNERISKRLGDFRAVELCNLEYVPQRASHIDAHTDDGWLWGERLVSVNLASGTLLCLTNGEQSTKQIWATMPRRSLFLMSGTARYDWKHAILPQHISTKRLVMTFRELSPQFASGDTEEARIGQQLLDRAYSFQTT